MIDDTIRSILADHGKLADDVGALPDSSDLYQAGLTSHASISVMLALEDAFDIEFPEAMLQKRTFESVAAIREAVRKLVGKDDP